MPLYAIALVLVLWCFFYTLTLGTLPEEAFIPSHYPKPIVSFRSTLRASLPLLFCGQGLLTDILRCSTFLAVYLFLLYLFCGFVTTNRKNPLKGLHGGYRDIIVVFALIPWWLWSCMLAHSNEIFQKGIALAPLTHHHHHHHSGLLSQAHTSSLLTEIPKSIIGVEIEKKDGLLDVPVPILEPALEPLVEQAHDKEEGRRVEALSKAIDGKAHEEDLAAHGYIPGPVRRIFRILSLDGGMNASCFFLLGGLIGHPLIPLIVRAGFFEASLSGRDVTKELSFGQMTGVVGRIAIISYFSSFHFSWALDKGEFTSRVFGYLLVAFSLLALGVKLKQRYYFHFHHYQACALLAWLCHFHSPALTMTLLGLLIAHHVDGACRFSVAPLFHRHRHAASWEGYH
jgi:hypothetical protein